MEKIISIEETTFKIKDGQWTTEYDGFLIKTDKQTVKLGIDNGQSCCENFGYFMTEDNFKEFEGSELKNISITDTLLNTKKVTENSIQEGEAMFVNIETSIGLLQFVAYNQHNGYYGHTAIVESTQFSTEEVL